MSSGLLSINYSALAASGGGRDCRHRLRRFGRASEGWDEHGYVPQPWGKEHIAPKCPLNDPSKELSFPVVLFPQGFTQQLQCN
ncbi:unnamed protein product [Linum trigynum]|uniref:Uncharacterized protein n=1 Tax=Linum trigynum TaxID=586398 RepID=A0AAV2E2D4_9ROSI